jgi:hypothetical protein
MVVQKFNIGQLNKIFSMRIIVTQVSRAIIRAPKDKKRFKLCHKMGNKASSRKIIPWKWDCTSR